MLKALRSIHIFRPGPRYNAVEAKRVSYEIHDEFGNGHAWIHPGYSQYNIYHPSSGRPLPPRHFIEKLISPGYEDIKRIFPEEEYRNYCERVRQSLNDFCYPLLLFIDHTQRKEMLDFLSGFSVRTRVIIEIPTERGYPTPLWDEPMSIRDSWQTLADILRSLGFSTIHLIGELGYWGYGTEQEGCVHDARRIFQALRFPTITLDKLIFPGGDL